MSHWKQLADYNYMGAYSFDGKVDQIVVTIKKVIQETVTGPGGKEDRCIVAYFEETNVSGIDVKPMILNKTNCKAIEKALGTGDIDGWIGKQIVVFETTTKWQRDLVPCLRIKDTPAPKQLKKKETQYFCSVCGKEINKNTYEASIAKYGTALCSAECKTEYEKTKQ